MISLINSNCSEIHIKNSDIALYLGYYGAKCDCSTQQTVDECREKFLKAAKFTACIKEVEIKIINGTVDLGFMQIKSKALAKNLCGCDRAYVFAATTGIEAHRLILRNNVISPTKGMVTDCIGSAAIETFCDKINALLGDAEYLRPRFSPGYGDMPLECQKNITEFLETKKNIGLTLNDSFMMTPVKSVTAIIGIGKDKNKCKGPGCMLCSRQNCPY